MSEELINCGRCERDRPASKNDPDFCSQCYFDVEQGGMMLKAEAARTYINQVAGSKAETKKLEMAAALSIFFPHIDKERQLKIVRDAFADKGE